MVIKKLIVISEKEVPVTYRYIAPKLLPSEVVNCLLGNETSVANKLTCSDISLSLVPILSLMDLKVELVGRDKVTPNRLLVAEKVLNLLNYSTKLLE